MAGYYGYFGGAAGFNPSAIDASRNQAAYADPGGNYGGYLPNDAAGGVLPQSGGYGNVGGEAFALAPDPGYSTPGGGDFYTNLGPGRGGGAPGGGGSRPTYPGGGVPASRYPAGLAAFNNSLGNAYTRNYNAALARNTALYNSIMAGYAGTGQRQVAAQQNIAQGYQNLGNRTLSYLQPMQTALQNQQQWQQGIRQGYGALTQQTLGDIQGIDASQRQQISDAYQAQLGSNAQNAVSRGLGNSTVLDSLNRGSLADKQKADIALSNQMAGLTAGYRSQLGLAGLGYENQANLQNTNQLNSIASAYANTNQQIGMAGLGYLNQANQQNTALDLSQYAFQNSVSMPYPNMGDYTRAAESAGRLAQGYRLA